MKSSTKFITLAAIGIVAVCGAVFGYKQFGSSKKDVAEERIGAALKKAIALLDAAPPVPALKPPTAIESVPEQFADVIDERARIRRGDISVIRRELPEALRRFESGDGFEDTVSKAVSSAYGPYEKALPALDKWVAEEPQSYAALVTRGIVRSRLGWHLRGGDYIPFTPIENLDGMTRLHLLAVEDFLLALPKSKYPVLAIADLISIAMAHGWEKESKQLYLAGERLSPSSSLLYVSYEPVLYTEWGTGSMPAAKAFLKHAEENGVSLGLRSSLMRHLMNIDNHERFSIGKPDALPHAIEFSERYDTVDGWLWRSKVARSLDRFEESLRSLQHAAEKSPTSASVMADIVWSLQKLNRSDDAKIALRRTADLGDDWAQDKIVSDMLWERNGEKRDWEKIRKECEASAEMMNPSGQACLGMLHSQGEAGYTKDLGKAVTWYELAARQGNARGQHDYGWMLLQGMGVKQDREKGLFNMRNSARQGFPYALQKLKQLGERTDNLEWKASATEDAKRKIARMLDRGSAWQGRY